MRYRSPCMPRALLRGLVLVLGQVPVAAQVEIHHFTGSSDLQFLGDRLGRAGDVDADGLEDFLIAAKGPARVLVRSGGSGGILLELVLPIVSSEGPHSLTSLGDIDGDGHGDFAVGTASFSQADKAVVVFSGKTGSLRYWIPPPAGTGAFGWCVANAGDVDTDGVDDLIVGAPSSSSDSSAFVHSGIDGSQLHEFLGTSPGDQFGFAVAGVGDVDGDGRADLMVGIPYADDPSNDTGAVQVFSGATWNLIHYFKGAHIYGRMGGVLTSPGDLDGDLREDLVFSASSYHAEARSGASGALLFTMPFEEPAFSAFSPDTIRSMPDVNSDGIPDLALATAHPYPPGFYVRSGADGSLVFRKDVPGIRAIDGLDDLDGDGRGDLLVSSNSPFSYKGSVVAYSSGAFQPPGSVQCAGDGSHGSCPCSGVVLFKEGFDGGVLPPGWTAAGLWHVTTNCAGFCGNDPFLYFGIDGPCNYDAGFGHNHSTFSPWIALPAKPQGKLLKLELCWTLGWEGEYENWIIGIHGSGGTSKYISFQGAPPPESFELNEFLGQSIQIEFRVWTDGIADFYAGWKIDDVTLRWGPNDGDPKQGCLNSSGHGAVLGGLGSTSAGADDLRLFASQMPAGMPATFVMGTAAANPPFTFGGGMVCFGGTVLRYPAAQTSALGTLTLEDPVAKSGGLIVPGSTYHFQAWFRDSNALAPCGYSSNLSNGYAVAFTP